MRKNKPFQGLIVSLAMLLMIFFVTCTLAGAQQEKVLYTFSGPHEFDPSGLVRDAQGNLYGTIPYGGGIRPHCGAGCGAAFKVTPSGRETVLHAFSGGAEGNYPSAGLVPDTQGNLYGTTAAGGALTCGFNGCGVVFRLSPTGTEKVLYTFSGGADGGAPYATLIRDEEGNLYGTTSCGGVYACYSAGGHGVVFELSAAGEFKVLYSFSGGPNGGNPRAGLVRDANGNLYGTALDGASACPRGCGVVFALSRAGEFKVLYRFTGGTDGGEPLGGLILDVDGNLYGTTAYGGGQVGCTCGGVVFEVTPAGEETVLYRFNLSYGGYNPQGSLIRDAVGNLYGTTNLGGNSGIDCVAYNYGCGTVFKLTPAGEEVVLWSFGGADGELPSAGLVTGTEGNLYGTTYDTVFELHP